MTAAAFSAETVASALTPRLAALGEKPKRQAPSLTATRGEAARYEPTEFGGSAQTSICLLRGAKSRTDPGSGRDTLPAHAGRQLT